MECALSRQENWEEYLVPSQHERIFSGQSFRMPVLLSFQPFPTHQPSLYNSTPEYKSLQQQALHQYHPISIGQNYPQTCEAK
jgi:hypothetical protein